MEAVWNKKQNRFANEKEIEALIENDDLSINYYARGDYSNSGQVWIILSDKVEREDYELRNVRV